MLHCLTEICNDSKAFDLSNAPPIEIVKFTGDPKDYLRFVNRFQDQVLSQPMPESKKLTCLIQHLDGRAKEAVKIFWCIDRSVKCIKVSFWSILYDSRCIYRPSLKINFQRRLTKCQVPTDWCLTLDILCLTKNINAIEKI
jgi:hypothetical protein